jgi:hypothetical protein
MDDIEDVVDAIVYLERPVGHREVCTSTVDRAPVSETSTDESHRNALNMEYLVGITVPNSASHVRRHRCGAVASYPDVLGPPSSMSPVQGGAPDTKAPRAIEVVRGLPTTSAGGQGTEVRAARE